MPSRRTRVTAPDISFPDDPKLARISQYVKFLERELHKVQKVLDLGTAGQVLTKLSGSTYDAAWEDAAAGGGGDAEGANLGAGEGEVFKIAITGTLNFRTLKQGTNITITQDGEEITIAATSTISVDWDDISGKPSTFPPSSHSQAATTVTFNNAGTGLIATDVQAAIAELAAAPPGSYTDEEAQDAVGTILVNTATVSWSYDDVTPEITADVDPSTFTIDWSQLDSIPALLTDFLTLGDPGADRILFWDDSASSLEWLTLGTNLTITGTTINAAGSSSPLTTKGDLYTYDTADARLAVGTDGYVLNARASEAKGLIWLPGADITPDTHPETVNPANDEFEFGSSIDTAGARFSGATAWAWRNQGGASAAVADGHLVFAGTGQTSSNLRIVEQTTSGSTWRYRTKLAGIIANQQNFSGAGICVVNSGTGQVMAMYKIYSGGWAIGGDRWTNVTTYGSSLASNVVYDNTTGHAAKGTWLYFQVEQTATQIIFRWSETGVQGTFIPFVTENLSNFITSVDRVGLVCHNDTIANAPTGIFGYWRKEA